MAAAVQQANVASAEPPLADWSHVATSATAEPPLPGEEIKHRFVLVNTHEKWLSRLLHIDVNHSCVLMAAIGMVQPNTARMEKIMLGGCGSITRRTNPR